MCSSEKGWYRINSYLACKIFSYFLIWQIETTGPSITTYASPTITSGVDGTLEEREKIEINLVSIKKQLEMVPSIEVCSS